MLVRQSEEMIRRYVEQYDMARFLNRDLLLHLRLFRFPASTNVYREQNTQQYLYFLVDGAVQCSHYQVNGRVAIFALSTPFAAIGDLEILTDEAVWSNVVAVEDTLMLGIASDVITHYGGNDPKFLRFLIDQLREKLYKTNSLQAYQVMPVIHRLAMYILTQQSQDNVVTLPAKEALASLLGTTTRHLNRVLKQLIEAGVIDGVYPRLRVLDRALLLNLPE